MNIAKFPVSEHEFEYLGEKIFLSLNNKFTSRQYKEYQDNWKAYFVNDDLEALAALVVFLILSWNLDDDNGAIPLDPKEVFERVPLRVQVDLVHEAQNALNNRKVEKQTTEDPAPAPEPEANKAA